MKSGLMFGIREVPGGGRKLRRRGGVVGEQVAALGASVPSGCRRWNLGLPAPEDGG